MTRRPLAVLGCTSNAGKSLVTTALCRWFHRHGVDVVPFKAQNMSNNARVVDGGEIGVAQWLQAHAARVEPDVRMNPVLLKPEADDRSQVVVAGQARADISAVPWRDRTPHLWPAMTHALDALCAEHELVVIEGAGSPAEINLPDLVNNGVVEHADAAAVLVADIDRGGAFAHLYGTWALVPPATRDRLAAFVLNKFRGDAGLLTPGPEDLAARTGMVPAGVLPMLRHELPDEEGATVRATPQGPAPVVAVVRGPFASNLDELHLLGHVAHVRWARRPAEVADADVVLLPGSKHVAADLDWMRAHGLDQAVVAAAGQGRRVIGVCGGAMMLGRRVVDPHGVEGAAAGLGLLDHDSELRRDKLTARTTVRFGALPSTFAALEGITAEGYEIRHGHLTDGAVVSAAGPVLATTVHGLFESPEVVHAVFGRRPPDVLEATFETLADAVDAHLDTSCLWTLAAIRGC